MNHFRLTGAISRRSPAGTQVGWLTVFRDFPPRPLRRENARKFCVERLEDRRLLSTDLVAIPASSASPLSASAFPTGLTPAQVRQAYGLNNLTFINGTIVGDGSGQTIAIVVAYDNPYIASDLHMFDQQYGLPDPSLQVIKQTASIRSDGGWGLETALDVEWAHAIAPGANILLVEAKSDSLTDLIAMVNVARQQPGVVTVSMSWGMNEFAGEKNYNSTFTTPAGHQGITFVAASGDDGSWLGASFPAISPNVLGVGGTTLSVSGDGTYLGETAWSGSGGGYSKFQAEPAYQKSAQGSGLRTSPDISWNAAVSSGVSVYSTLSDSGRGGWFAVGGTSAGTPAWAAIVAIADQGRAIYGQGSLSGAQSLLYSLPSYDFHDITAGRNGYSASAGYDVVTGLGSPYADRVVAGLVTSYNSGAGNFSAAASPSKVRRLSRLHARRHDEVGDETVSAIGVALLDTGASTSTTGSSTVIQVTTINANQALVVTVVSSNGKLVEEFIVPIPSLDISSITPNHTIAPITASLLISVNVPPDVQLIGQGDDPQVPTASTSTSSGESPIPSVTDFLDRRRQHSNKKPGVDPKNGIPANVAPQDPPAPPLNKGAPLPPTSKGEIGDILTRWERSLDLEWSADLILLEHFAAMSRREIGKDLIESEPEESAEGSELVAAAAVAIGGARLIRVRSRRNRPVTETGKSSETRPRSSRNRKPGTDPFRCLLERNGR